MPVRLALDTYMKKGAFIPETPLIAVEVITNFFVLNESTSSSHVICFIRDCVCFRAGFSVRRHGTEVGRVVKSITNGTSFGVTTSTNQRYDISVS